jgi:hypothetical protein
MTRIINEGGRDVTRQTIEAVAKLIHDTGVGMDGSADDLKKATGTVTTSTGLVAYDLEPEAKNLYPVITPIVNKIPRKLKSVGAGTAANWKEVSAIAGASGLPAVPWVPEGQRAPRMSLTTADRSASYKTAGLESDVTFEAESAAAGFEDEMAASGVRLLHQTKILEELACIGGNNSVELGTPTTPTVSASGSGATLPAATYKVGVIALTFEGYQMATVMGGVKRAVTLTGMDAKTYDLNGGSSKASALATQAVTLGQTLFMSTPAIRGAVAYAWYVGVSGSEKLEAITTINSYAISADLAATGQAWSAISDGTTDRSKNTEAFDGILYHVFKSGSLGYYRALATGTAGTGTTLTASARGTIAEIDTMLKDRWDNYRLSFEELYVSSQELTNIYSRCFVNGSNPLVRFVVDAGNPQQVTFAAGQILGWYVNPYSMNGGQFIPIRLHPNLPAGTIMGWAQNLPAQYVTANVPQTLEMKCRREYYQIPWPVVTRARATGVYVEEVLACYATFSLGVITNIANG